MHKTVSVIIPIYNAEGYLRDCLENITNQTLNNMEVILVNDASTDGSLAIMNDYMMRYPDLIKIINSEVNQGAGGARNQGIEIATGEYIGFVDSDDLIEPAMYEKLYLKACEGSYDFVDSGYYKQADDLSIIHTTDEMTGVLDVEKRKQFIVSGGYIVSKIFRKELFSDTMLRFRKNVILEDADFLTYLYATAKTVGNVKEVLYYYRDQKDSSSKTTQVEKYYYNICEAMSAIYQKVKGLNIYEELRRAVEYEILQMYSYGVNICLKANAQEGDETTKERLIKIAQQKELLVKGSYENPFVESKIAKMDIGIMKLNDESPEKLLALYKAGSS